MRPKVKTILILFVITLSIGGLAVSLYQAIKTRNELSETKQLIISEKGERIMAYFETIDFHDDKYLPDADEQTAKIDQIAKYIYFAATAISNEQAKTVISFDDIAKTVSENFTDADYHTEDYQLACASVILNLNNIFCDELNKEITLNRTTDPRAIAATPIIKYLPKETNRKSTDYAATYERYEFENPYDILNYAADSNSQLVPQIKSYLEGAGQIRDIKDAITRDAAAKYGKKTGEITVRFSVEGEKFRVKDYREN